MIKKFVYTLWLILFCVCVFIFIKDTNFRNFLIMMENRTFDMRQSVLVQNNAKKHNDNIVIIAVDDASYEYILEKYGEWPIPRDIYVKLVNYIEAQEPEAVAFDLMFVKSLKSNPKSDKALIEAFKKYDNLYTSMNFDDQDETLRQPPKLPKKLTVNVDNNSPAVDLEINSYTNCRKILDGIINATSNIGITNVTRSDDGILRKIPVFLGYNGEYYPQLGFAVGLNHLKREGSYTGRNFTIDYNSNLNVGNRSIYLDNDGSVILNWYGGNKTYQYIPLYKLIQISSGKVPAGDINFKDKIVYFGTTAASLFDIKTVPVSRNFPGVEIQATFINNLIDNNFIKKFNRVYTVEIGLILALITILIVLSENSAFMGAIASMSVYMLYVFLTYFLMKYFNWWLDIVYPLLFAIITFIGAYIIKYLIKSRDFEQQYILATTDGLTELYNHRYFQEQMKQMVDSSKRYETQFSLIILDIDFFKKFNDTFGHQAGDAVLRQVAQTLKKNVRSSDIVCRYGGEEMSIILANTDYETAVSTAKKICNRVSARPFKLPNGKDTTVTISLGVSTYPKDGITSSELIEAADKHLYNAKNNGRNQVGL